MHGCGSPAGVGGGGRGGRSASPCDGGGRDVHGRGSPAGEEGREEGGHPISVPPPSHPTCCSAAQLSPPSPLPPALTPCPPSPSPCRRVSPAAASSWWDVPTALCASSAWTRRTGSETWRCSRCVWGVGLRNLVLQGAGLRICCAGALSGLINHTMFYPKPLLPSSPQPPGCRCPPPPAVPCSCTVLRWTGAAQWAVPRRRAVCSFM